MGNLTTQTMGQCEARQYEGRLTTFVVDECHIPLSTQITANYLVQCGKMSRKIGLDLYMATQNPEDFKDSAVKLLQIFENFELLSFKSHAARKKVIEDLLDLGDKAVRLNKSIANLSGKYSESLLINERFLFIDKKHAN